MNNIMYRSTRGGNNFISSAEAIVKGIAEDGGLFVPNEMPTMPFALDQIVKMEYKELAYQVMKMFLSDFTESELRNCIEKAYDQKFDTSEIAPVTEKADTYFLELFHGPTLAFKDMALTVLPYLMKTAMKKLGIEKEVVILTATSGDTGKAALEGFADVEGIKIIVYFPEHGVSDVQKMQMVTQTGKNTFVIGIEGNFDDAQNGVKQMFGDKELIANMNKNGFVFSSANSINIGRLVPQVVYYFYAYAQACKAGGIKAGEEINFTVPTGNFGNILAGYYAKRMGLPIKNLICASNENKVLFDFISTGIYDKVRDFIVTTSPSMDILISSNLERLLFVLAGNDSVKTAELMQQLSKNGKYQITDEMKKNLAGFAAGYASEKETSEAIKDVYEKSGYIIDTHTAVAYKVYRKYIETTGDTTKNVVVSTASPYKFTADVMKSINEKYNSFNDFDLIRKMGELAKEEIPAAIKDIEKRPVLHKIVCQTSEMKAQVERILGI